MNILPGYFSEMELLDASVFKCLNKFPVDPPLKLTFSEQTLHFAMLFCKIEEWHHTLLRFLFNAVLLFFDENIVILLNTK